MLACRPISNLDDPRGCRWCFSQLKLQSNIKTASELQLNDVRGWARRRCDGHRCRRNIIANYTGAAATSACTAALAQVHNDLHALHRSPFYTCYILLQLLQWFVGYTLHWLTVRLWSLWYDRGRRRECSFTVSQTACQYFIPTKLFLLLSRVSSFYRPIGLNP